MNYIHDDPLTPEELAMLRRNAQQARTLWPFKTMQVGDTVTIPAPMARRARSAMYTVAHRSGHEFFSRMQADGTLKIARIG